MAILVYARRTLAAVYDRKPALATKWAAPGALSAPSSSVPPPTKVLKRRIERPSERPSDRPARPWRREKPPGVTSYHFSANYFPGPRFGF
jgi:hypothetical protein